MARWFEELDALATELGLRTFSSFFSYDIESFKGMFGGEDELEAAKQSARPIEYFDVREALKTVRALRQELGANPPRFAQHRGKDQSERLLTELAECEEVLQAGEKADTGVRFWVGE